MTQSFYYMVRLDSKYDAGPRDRFGQARQRWACLNGWRVESHPLNFV